MRYYLTAILAQQDAPPNPPPVDTLPGSDAQQQTLAPGQAPGTTPNNGPPPPQPPMGQFLWIVIVMIAVMMFFTMGSQRKEKKKREAMLTALKKGDKIQTVGGILGTVVEVRDSDVIVKVDESNNSRIKFARSAIQSVLQEQE